MTTEIIRSLTWVGMGVGLVLVVTTLELVLRALTARFGTPQGELRSRAIGRVAG
jgi:hypothetical protein